MDTRPLRYRFAESWTAPAAPAAVRDVLVDLEHYPDWWPQVVAVASLGPDDALVLCRSGLPYTLDLRLHAVRRELPTLEVRVGGVLDGWVRWTLTAEGPHTRIDVAQEVRARGALAWASLVGRPLLRWNHARMMAGCRAGLAARLGAQRA